MRGISKVLAGALVGLGLPTAAGCGPGVNGRYPVTGTVTLDGKPLADGTVVFVPVGDGRIKAGGTVVNGVYEVEAKYGPNPGPHRVEIFWLRPTGRKIMADGQLIDERETVVPPEYNANSTLTAVVESGDNKFDFQIESKRPK